MGTVGEARKNRGGMRARISRPAGWKVAPGDSVSVDGICSTVARLARDRFEVDYMPETLARTTAGSFKNGSRVNLELPLRASDRLDGHIVQGHVDARGEVRAVRKVGDSVVLTIGFPKEYAQFIAEKGSIAVNGVSLTVTAVAGGGARMPYFSVALVAYTLAHTNLRALRKGDKVNLEVDIIARYLRALIRK